MLCPKSLHQALKILKFNPETDMFESNINYQFHTYLSYKADPKAKAVDSFTISWYSLKFYASPSSSVISRTLKKIKVEKAEVILAGPILELCWCNYCTQFSAPGFGKIFLLEIVENDICLGSTSKQMSFFQKKCAP